MGFSHPPPHAVFLTQNGPWEVSLAPLVVGVYTYFKEVIYIFSYINYVNIEMPNVCINCSQLEGALSKWTSYQDDVRQFTSWMDKVEAVMNASERQSAELREKNASLSKSKVCAKSNLRKRITAHTLTTGTI